MMMLCPACLHFEAWTNTLKMTSSLLNFTSHLIVPNPHTYITYNATQFTQVCDVCLCYSCANSTATHFFITTLILFSPNICALLPPQFSSEGCGHTKSCLREPLGCDPQSDPRCFFLSFATDEEDRSVTFELSGPAEGYVSFALSLDKWMVGFIKRCFKEFQRTLFSC